VLVPTNPCPSNARTGRTSRPLTARWAIHGSRRRLSSSRITGTFAGFASGSRWCCVFRTPAIWISPAVPGSGTWARPATGAAGEFCSTLAWRCCPTVARCWACCTRIGTRGCRGSRGRPASNARRVGVNRKCGPTQSSRWGRAWGLPVHPRGRPAQRCVGDLRGRRRSGGGIRRAGQARSAD